MVINHSKAIKRTYVSLEGLSVGDAFGEQFFIKTSAAMALIESRTLPVPPSGYVWSYTDDTNMALSLVASLSKYQTVNQNWLAQSFADHYEHSRGYGGGMLKLLSQIQGGANWSEAARDLFGGEGSYGNGAAMRVAPLGAYFAEDLDLLVDEAKRSAEVTHAHPEGIAGAIAVAVAAAIACQWAAASKKPQSDEFLREILLLVPDSEVKIGIEMARQMLGSTSVSEVVEALGSGDEITAQDTVPFTLWCAARHLDDYEAAIWTTVSGLGDRDTTCAIVGGIVACYTGLAAIPEKWVKYREPLPDWFFAAIES